jgi:hypothetical protein
MLFDTSFADPEKALPPTSRSKGDWGPEANGLQRFSDRHEAVISDFDEIISALGCHPEVA